MVPNINTVKIFKRNCMLPQNQLCLLISFPSTHPKNTPYKQVKLQSGYLNTVTITNPFQLITFKTITQHVPTKNVLMSVPVFLISQPLTL